jgi:hypothetical protein
MVSWPAGGSAPILQPHGASLDRTGADYFLASDLAFPPVWQVGRGLTQSVIFLTGITTAEMSPLSREQLASLHCLKLFFPTSRYRDTITIFHDKHKPPLWKAVPLGNACKRNPEGPVNLHSMNG